MNNKVLLNRAIRSAIKTIGIMLPTVDELYVTCVIKKTNVLKDISHPLNKFYSVVKSGCGYLHEKPQTNRNFITFLATYIRLLKARSGIGMCEGRWEEDGLQ